MKNEEILGMEDMYRCKPTEPDMFGTINRQQWRKFIDYCNEEHRVDVTKHNVSIEKISELWNEYQTNIEENGSSKNL